MTKKVPIKLNTSNALRWLGSLYRNPADALKEHVSNAIDEHTKALANGSAVPVCEVTFKISKKQVAVEYPYGMSKEEFTDALQRVADSAKRHLDFNLIGRLGIGMFSFLQIGNKCEFFSKKGKGFESIKVTLRTGADQAEFEKPTKREAIAERGIRIMIKDLLFDPTRPRGPLAPGRLQKVLAEKFDRFLREGTLAIRVHVGEKTHEIAPLKIDLPRVGEAYRDWHLLGNRAKRMGLELYYDPSAKGRVGIRHMGVVVAASLGDIDAYGIEESVFGSGHVRGFVDADFLTPLPARTGFEESDDWVAFLAELDRMRPAIEAEVESLRAEEAAEKLAEVQKKAVELAKEILNMDDFGDLELLEGLGRKKRERRMPPNGFAFSPASLRIEQGKVGRVSLKALVPDCVPDGSLVRFTVSDAAAIELRTDMAILKASDANNSGVVTTPVRFVGRLMTTELADSRLTPPVVLTACAEGGMTAEARIRVGEFKLERHREPLTGADGKGTGINYREVAFEDGSTRHSRYVARVIEINELNNDYKRAVLDGSTQSQLAYAAMMIGKETIAFNDKSGRVDEYLEKMLSFYFRMRDKVGDPSGRRRGRGMR